MFLLNYPSSPATPLDWVIDKNESGAIPNSSFFDDFQASQKLIQISQAGFKAKSFPDAKSTTQSEKKSPTLEPFRRIYYYRPTDTSRYARPDL